MQRRLFVQWDGKKHETRYCCIPATLGNTNLTNGKKKPQAADCEEWQALVACKPYTMGRKKLQRGL